MLVLPRWRHAHVCHHPVPIGNALGIAWCGTPGRGTPRNQGRPADPAAGLCGPAKDADPKRLEAFKQGLTEGATQFTFSAGRSALQKLGLSLPPDLTARVTDWFD